MWIHRLEHPTNNQGPRSNGDMTRGWWGCISHHRPWPYYLVSCGYLPSPVESLGFVMTCQSFATAPKAVGVLKLVFPWTAQVDKHMVSR